MGFRDMCPRPARSLLGGGAGEGDLPIRSPHRALSSLVTAIEPLCVCEIVNVCVCVFSRMLSSSHHPGFEDNSSPRGRPTLSL